MTIQLVIVNDSPTLSAGLRAVLANSQEIEILAEVNSGAEALAQITALRPDVVLLGCHLPDTTGETVALEIRAHDLPSRVLGFSTCKDKEHIKGFLSAGVWGYLLATENEETLIEAVRAVAQGNFRLSSEIASLVSNWGREKTSTLDELTNREREILQHIAMGETNGQIALALSISVGTVKNHIIHVYDKLGVHSRVQAAMWASRHISGSLDTYT